MWCPQVASKAWGGVIVGGVCLSVDRMSMIMVSKKRIEATKILENSGFAS